MFGSSNPQVRWFQLFKSYQSVWVAQPSPQGGGVAKRQEASSSATNCTVTGTDAQSAERKISGHLGGPAVPEGGRVAKRQEASSCDNIFSGPVQ